MTTVSTLEEQIAVLKAAIAAPKPVITESPAVSAPVTVNLNDLRSMIREVIAETKSVVVDNPNNKEYTMLEAVNLALTDDEQLWLRKDDVIKGVANFMATDNGQVITRQFITDYRKHYEN